jgi:hypothetical protein
MSLSGQVVEKIKDGSMGAVYKVRHLLLDEVRVIKVIHPRLGVTQDLSDRGDLTYDFNPPEPPPPQP